MTIRESVNDPKILPCSSVNWAKILHDHPRTDFQQSDTKKGIVTPGHLEEILGEKSTLCGDASRTHRNIQMVLSILERQHLDTRYARTTFFAFQGNAIPMGRHFCSQLGFSHIDKTCLGIARFLFGNSRFGYKSAFGTS